VNHVEKDQEERDDDEEIVESQETDENEAGFLGITLYMRDSIQKIKQNLPGKIQI
jgi:hypothetical protein